MRFCFMKRLFYTVLQESMSVASQKKTAIVGGRVYFREADYMCFSPLRRKTSELEGIYL
jgi:hypothetical protein